MSHDNLIFLPVESTSSCLVRIKTNKLFMMVLCEVCICMLWHAEKEFLGKNWTIKRCSQAWWEHESIISIYLYIGVQRQLIMGWHLTKSGHKAKLLSGLLRMGMMFNSEVTNGNTKEKNCNCYVDVILNSNVAITTM